ncbi:MAG: hypothetical protein Q8R60_11150 [Mycobacteriales bacterium]|nr:hypothetical protein [Mycobacteriales bacterium]
MSGDLLRSLAALVRGLDADHACLAAALCGRPSGLPLDPALAALHREIVVLRALDPDLSALHLLGAAGEPFGDAVQQHLTWLDARACGEDAVTWRRVVPALPLAC